METEYMDVGQYMQGKVKNPALLILSPSEGVREVPLY